MSRDLTEVEAHRYLAARGFRNPARADELLQQLADDLPTRLALGELAELLLDNLSAAADPDAAAAGFCRYVANRFPKSSFIGYLHDDPRTLQILTALLGASALLGEILIRNPDHLHWLHRELDCPPPDLADYRAEVHQLLGQDPDAGHRLDMLKRFQRRETLRIAGRDLLDKDTLRSTTEQLSNLADVLVGAALRTVRANADHAADGPGGSFAIIGMDRLGGREASYSAEIRLFCVYESTDAGADARFEQLGRQLAAGLTETTGAGYLYRIVGGLRSPDGPDSGAGSLEQCVEHCRRAAGTRELSALVRMRPIAGDHALGQRFLEAVRPLVFGADRDQAGVAPAARGGPGDSGDVELYTRRLQLLHGARRRDLRGANTLSALTHLQTHGLIPAAAAESLAAAYTFLRSLEHRMQIAGETAADGLPADAAGMEIAARRMGFSAAADFEIALAAQRREALQCRESPPGRAGGRGAGRSGPR